MSVKQPNVDIDQNNEEVQESVSIGRALKGKQQKIVAFTGILLSGFAVYVNSFINMQEIYRNVLFLALLFVLAFLLYPATKKGANNRFTTVDIILTIASIAGSVYILLFYTTIHVDRMSQAVTMDYIFAGITVVLLLEAARRTLESLHSAFNEFSDHLCGIWSILSRDFWTRGVFL